MRDLVVAYRLVPSDRRVEYNRAWLELRDLAERLGLRAWRFRSLDAGDEFVEFLEGSVTSAAEALARLEPLRGALDQVSPTISDREWEEAPAAPAEEPVPDDSAELLALLRDRSLERGEFVLASGQRSDYYIDARPATMSAQGQRLIGRLGVSAIAARGWAPAAVGGLTLGADPVAYAVAHASSTMGRPIDAFTVRKQAKTHGTGRRIEGNLGPGMDVVVVEDVMTSGASALEAVEAVHEAGAHVLGVLTVVDREAGGLEKLVAAGHSCIALFTANRLLQD